MSLSLGKGPLRSGPPPSIGWWPIAKDNVLRYWNGEWWSVPCPIWYIAIVAGGMARERSLIPTGRVMWRERGPDWPKGK